MEGAMTAAVVTAALFFSLSCALLVEELVVGGLFRLFFAPQRKRPRQRNQSGQQ